MEGKGREGKGGPAPDDAQVVNNIHAGRPRVTSHPWGGWDFTRRQSGQIYLCAVHPGGNCLDSVL